MTDPKESSDGQLSQGTLRLEILLWQVEEALLDHDGAEELPSETLTLIEQTKNVYHTEEAMPHGWWYVEGPHIVDGAKAASAAIPQRNYVAQTAEADLTTWLRHLPEYADRRSKAAKDGVHGLTVYWLRLTKGLISRDIDEWIGSQNLQKRWKDPDLSVEHKTAVREAYRHMHQAEFNFISGDFTSYHDARGSLDYKINNMRQMWQSVGKRMRGKSGLDTYFNQLQDQSGWIVAIDMALTMRRYMSTKIWMPEDITRKVEK